MVRSSELANGAAWRGRIGGTRGGVTDRRTHRLGRAIRFDGQCTSRVTSVSRQRTSLNQQPPQDSNQYLYQPPMASGVAAADNRNNIAGILRDEALGTLMLDDLLHDLALDMFNPLHRESPVDHWFRHLGQ